MPHDLDTEQALLGAILINNDAYTKAADIIRPEMFFEEIHQVIYQAIVDNIEGGLVATPITVGAAIHNFDLGGVTVKQYLARLCAGATTIFNAADYAKTIREFADRRRLISVMATIQELAYGRGPEASVKNLLARVDAEVNYFTPPGKDPGGFAPFGESVREAMVDANEAWRAGGRVIGHQSGLHELDQIVAGFQKTDLIIIGGRPAMGKTSLALSIALNVAYSLKEKRDEGIKTGVVGFFSLEMGRSQLAGRLISYNSNVPQFRIRKGAVSEEEITRYVDSGRAISDLPIEIDPTGEISISVLRRRARALKKAKGLELLIVDYLQLIKSDDKNKNRFELVTEVSGALKGLAKELDVPVIALSQLSRKIEEREDKRPMMSDLRESGSIEQDADVALFCYRDHYYACQNEPRNGSQDARLRWEEKKMKAEGWGEVIVAKNRHGPSGTAILGWDERIGFFHNEVPEAISIPERAKLGKGQERVRITQEAFIALGILHDLTMSSSVSGDLIANAPDSSRPLPYDLWKTECANLILDPDAIERGASNLMKKICMSLARPGGGEPALIGRCLEGDAPYVWLTKRGGSFYQELKESERRD